MTRVAVLLAAHDTNELCALVEREDMSMQAIADLWGCTKRQLQLWIDGDYRRAERAREARKNAADTCARKATQVLLDLTSLSTVADVARARELAHHYRWLAKVRDPATHGDKVQVSHNLNTNADDMTDAQLEAIAKAGDVYLAIEGECEEVDV